MTTPQPTAEQIAAIREREQKATPGPWFHWLATTEFIGWTVQVAAGWLFKQSDKCGEHDAEFIAHARQDIPFLLEALSALQQQIMEQQQALTAAQADVTIHLQRRQALEQQVAALTQGAECARERANQEIARRERAEVAYTQSEQKRLALIDAKEAAEQQVAALTQELQAIAYRVGEHASIEALLADRDEMTVYLKVEALVQRLETVEQELDAAQRLHREVSYVCHDQADALEAAEARLARLRELTEQWRYNAKAARANADNEKIPALDRRQCFGVSQAYEQCADELDAVLAEGPAPAAKEGKADGD